MRRKKKKKIALALRSALAQWNKVLQKIWKGIQFDGNQLPSSIYTETPGKWKCFLRDLFVQRLDPEPPDPGYEPRGRPFPAHAPQSSGLRGQKAAYAASCSFPAATWPQLQRASEHNLMRDPEPDYPAKPLPDYWPQKLCKQP